MFHQLMVSHGLLICHFLYTYIGRVYKEDAKILNKTIFKVLKNYLPAGLKPMTIVMEFKSIAINRLLIYVRNKINGLETLAPNNFVLGIFNNTLFMKKEESKISN